MDFIHNNQGDYKADNQFKPLLDYPCQLLKLMNLKQLILKLIFLVFTCVINAITINPFSVVIDFNLFSYHIKSIYSNQSLNPNYIFKIIKDILIKHHF